MAKVYATKGPTEVNKLMGDFDKISDDMQEKIEKTAQALADANKIWEAEEDGTGEELAQLRFQLLVVGLVSLAGLVLANVFGVIAVNALIVRPISAASDAFM